MNALDRKMFSLVSQLRDKLSSGSFTEAEFCAFMILLRDAPDLKANDPCRWIADSIAHRKRDRTDRFYEIIVAMSVSHNAPDAFRRVLKSENGRKAANAEERIDRGREAYLREAESQGPLLADGSFFSAVNSVLKSVGISPLETGLQNVLELFAVSIVQGVYFFEAEDPETKKTETVRTAVILSEGYFAAVVGRHNQSSLRPVLLRAADPRTSHSRGIEIWDTEPMQVTFSNWLVEVSTV